MAYRTEAFLARFVREHERAGMRGNHRREEVRMTRRELFSRAAGSVAVLFTAGTVAQAQEAHDPWDALPVGSRWTCFKCGADSPVQSRKYWDELPEGWVMLWCEPDHCCFEFRCPACADEELICENW